MKITEFWKKAWSKARFEVIVALVVIVFLIVWLVVYFDRVSVCRQHNLEYSSYAGTCVKPLGDYK